MDESNSIQLFEDKNTHRMGGRTGRMVFLCCGCYRRPDR